MEKILEMYGYNPTKEEVAKKLASIVKDASKLMTPSNLDKCLSYMDLTTLNTTDTEARVIKFAENVNEFKKSFPNYSTPASICIYPNLGKAVKDNLKVPGVNVTVVAGVFPNSQSFLEVKLLECKFGGSINVRSNLGEGTTFPVEMNIETAEIDNEERIALHIHPFPGKRA